MAIAWVVLVLHIRRGEQHLCNGQRVKMQYTPRACATITLVVGADTRSPFVLLIVRFPAAGSSQQPQAPHDLKMPRANTNKAL